MEDVQIEPYPFSDEADGLGISAPVKIIVIAAVCAAVVFLLLYFRKKNFRKNDTGYIEIKTDKRHR